MNSPESFKLTEQRVANYNENHGKKLAEFRQRPDGNYFVVLLDPLILHVHEVNISYFISLEMFSHIHSLPCHKWSITIHHVQCTPLPHLLEMQSARAIQREQSQQGLGFQPSPSR